MQFVQRYISPLFILESVALISERHGKAIYFPPSGAAMVTEAPGVTGRVDRSSAVTLLSTAPEFQQRPNTSRRGRTQLQTS